MSSVAARVARSRAAPAAVSSPRKLRPIIELYHRAEEFPGPTNGDLIKHIDAKFLMTSQAAHGPRHMTGEQAALLRGSPADLLPSAASARTYHPKYPRAREFMGASLGAVGAGAGMGMSLGAGMGMGASAGTGAAAAESLRERYDMLLDSLCGTTARGRAGLETVEDKWPGIARCEERASGAKAQAGETPAKEHHDRGRSDIDGEGGEVGRPQGGGRGAHKGAHEPTPKKHKKPGQGAHSESDAEFSALDGEGADVGRQTGRGKGGH